MAKKEFPLNPKKKIKKKKMPVYITGLKSQVLSIVKISPLKPKASPYIED